jgi:AraC-like DNA-binding protein
MRNKEYPDIIPLLKHLCLSLQPYAATRQISIHFTSRVQKVRLQYKAHDVLCGFSGLLCSILDFMPDNSILTVRTKLTTIETIRHLSVIVHNTGVNLSRIAGLTHNCHIPVRLCESLTNATSFSVHFALSLTEAPGVAIQEPQKSPSLNLPVYYQEVRKKLQGHFAKMNNPLARLNETHPRETGFVTRIKHCILENMEDPRFDANALSTAMAISRAQLFRNLKSSIGIPPACYIRSLRLQKAKELLETEDLSVSQVTYKTGFDSPSHFTKVFTRKYGIRPSLFRRPKPGATNE